ncbi:uncharacterized protein [Garra rufa]|uniref:uncharacterized protein n=1 Tax=Garra rufa TaxID=137080 RepID=UPI003CCE92D4
MKIKFVSKLLSLLMYLLVCVVSDVDTNTVFVMEGDSVTLKFDLTIIQENWVSWEIHHSLIARHNGTFSDICSDVQCKDRNKGLRDRLKVDQNGSLTITNASITDSGDYWISIHFRNVINVLLNSVVVRGLFSFDTDGVSVMEGDSVTLHTGDQMKQSEVIKWYFNNTAIAGIFGDLRYSCTDVQCEGDEKFRGRLKLDHQTGYLTIRDVRTTDSGLYDLLINNVPHHSSSSRTKIFIVAVYDVLANKQDEMKKKSVKEGQSVTLDCGVVKPPHDLITWYFNDTLIAEIKGDLRKICTDKKCKKRFKHRLKVKHHTRSLTITNTRTTDSGLFKLQINSSRFSIERSFSVIVTVVSGFGAGGVPVSMKEEDSVTLYTGVKTNQKEKIEWYFIDTLIAEITGDFIEICTNVQCKERFRDRLKVDEFGALTIVNIRTEDAGVYKLKISGSSIITVFRVFVTSHFVGSDKVSVKEGDSVTLHTDVNTNQQKEIIWRFNDVIIAEITGDLSFTCTDVQCNEDNERFRRRLKLDNQTGSLTITYISITDSGVFEQQINSNSSSIRRNVRITVTGVSAAERDQMKRTSVKEGETVTLDTCVEINKLNNLMWHFNETPIAEINGEPRNICTDDRCEYADGRFRLEVDHQTGSLTIKNTRITDSGVYKLQLISNSSIRITSEKSFSVTVTANLTEIYAAVPAVLMSLVASAGLIYSCKHHSIRKYIRTQRNNQTNGVEDSSSNQTDPLATNTLATSPNQTESETTSETT